MHTLQAKGVRRLTPGLLTTFYISEGVAGNVSDIGIATVYQKLRCTHDLRPPCIESSSRHAHDVCQSSISRWTLLI